MDPIGSAAGESPPGRAQSRYDQLLKWMPTRAHDDFLAWWLPISRDDIVRLWEIPQERVLTMPEYGLWPLASLMVGTSVEATVSIAERLAAVQAPERERSELIGLLANLAGVNIPQDVLLSAFRSKPMIDDLLEESSIATGIRRGG